MKKIDGMKLRAFRNYYFQVITILFLTLVQADIRAATITLSRPITLQPETIIHLEQASTTGTSQWKLIVFGFTHCKDVCPMSLVNLSTMVKTAISEQIDINGIFVTVDPDRDTEAILANYTKSFGTDISYLRFEGEELERFKNAFQVEAIFYTKNVGNQTHYQVDHSTTAFLVDPAGRIRVIFDALKDARDMARIFHEDKKLFKS
ncbi:MULTISPECIES: SCO family protein [Nitrosomonas]|uniref:Protein SCO1/2 n=2 Tax=Nitrosomonas eutropha TaxID=916 RepID=A0ABX5M3H2_9PROT|nr:MULTISPECIES: SCO family protein [Nitrosomonas]ABI60212.1 electron transport protein SCO1/SenC [Nitrosomonas eutropha C91]MXS81407.1 SCO family protein [Nitrosomonas sp. GH22]PXV74210.1 protein SCO1/2 [Nitrosomonas eutropha]SDX08302.1 protein SCO1/2 [Nitrosomonas eutropha]SEJ27603.1 protein SCO1/2 [Nitrosomonas eutropha]